MPEENQSLFYEGVISVYGKLLAETAKNKFYIDTVTSINSAIEGLQISEEKKAELLISHQSNMANSTISKSMDQSVMIFERSSKIDLENALLQKQIDDITNSIEVRTAQSTKDIEVKSAQIVSMAKEDSVKDRQALDIAKSTEVKTAQIESMGIEDTIKQAQSTKDIEVKTAQIVSMTKEDLVKDKQALDIAKSTEVKTAQITSITKDNLIKDKQVEKLDEEIDLLEAQESELRESILDRQQKRPVEVANLTKQGDLIDGQVGKIIEDKLYVTAQKTSMLEQVEHNKIIKAMDSMGDMIGTIGAGGLVPSSAMFGVYFRLNKLLTNESEPSSYSITKVV